MVTRITIFILLGMMSFGAVTASAQSPFESEDSVSIQEDKFSDDPDELVREAELLLAKKQPIDARARLQKALQLRPEDYRIHLMLGQYYLAEVGHFTLAYRYIRRAEELFMQKYQVSDGFVVADKLREQVMLLYLRAEAELSLDKYQDSLNTLDRLAKVYPPAELSWYMATRAWVLMKLKRLDEAVQAAQQGLLIDEDSKRIYNILGILLSLKGNRELSLRAFAKAAAGEMRLGSFGQAATPLNNAGEVYRELFKDSLAEASWIRALQMPDGCEHVLPSLNTSILYIDQVRFFQADRTLKDFEVCYSAQSTRQDTEHRALLALSRGRIALHIGEFDQALELLKAANEREQWFGKIGTNENDVRLAATIAMANALTAKVGALRDTVRDRWSDRLNDMAEIPQIRIRAWWLQRQARRMALEELADFEDLELRNSDTMIEYPTLGSTLAGFPVKSLERRINRLLESDDRGPAKDHYRLYFAWNLMHHGKTARALPLLVELRKTLRPIDRLARAEVLTLLLKAEAANSSWWRSKTLDEKRDSLRTREELFELLPSRFRSADLSLPVISNLSSTEGTRGDLAKKVRKSLALRLPEADADEQPASNYVLKIVESKGEKNLTVSLIRKADNMLTILANESGTISSDGTGYEALVNKFTAAVFHHRKDLPGELVPKLELFDEIMNR